MRCKEIAAKCSRKNVPGVASVQTTEPARRECGRESRTLSPEEKDRSPAAIYLTSGTAKVGEPDELKARTGPYLFLT